MQRFDLVSLCYVLELLEGRFATLCNNVVSFGNVLHRCVLVSLRAASKLRDRLAVSCIDWIWCRSAAFRTACEAVLLRPALIWSPFAALCIDLNLVSFCCVLQRFSVHYDFGGILLRSASIW